MNRDELLALAQRVLTLPTAPYHEHDVQAAVIGLSRSLANVRVEQDRAGNVIARYCYRAATPPLVYVAHMDHPGFGNNLGENGAEVSRRRPPREMFVKGGRVRVYPGGSNDYSTRVCSRARIQRLVTSAWPKRKLVELRGRSVAQR